MIEVNYLAIVIAGIVSMALGFIWYHPIVLGKPWMKEKGFTPESLKKSQKEMGKFYGVSFVVSLITAYVLAHVIVMSENYFHNAMLMTGLMTAFWSWLGFMMPVQLNGTIFGDKNFKLFGIDTGYQLVSILAMGAVLGYL
ncbi:MAG: DUF1761 domain-containing protein [Patescibacteria group bacterium]